MLFMDDVYSDNKEKKLQPIDDIFNSRYPLEMFVRNYIQIETDKISRQTAIDQLTNEWAFCFAVSMQIEDLRKAKLKESSKEYEETAEYYLVKSEKRTKYLQRKFLYMNLFYKMDKKRVKRAVESMTIRTIVEADRYDLSTRKGLMKKSIYRKPVLILVGEKCETNFSEYSYQWTEEEEKIKNMSKNLNKAIDKIENTK